MADSNLRAIAENKIKELEKEISVLKGELCAGEMSGKENKIRSKIRMVERSVNLLRNFIKGNLEISEEDWLQDECSRHDQEIARLNELKSSIDGRLEAINAVKRLLSI
jgi:hypothetical protein